MGRIIYLALITMIYQSGCITVDVVVPENMHLTLAGVW